LFSIFGHKSGKVKKKSPFKLLFSEYFSGWWWAWVRLGKSKCGATVSWLAGGVAPLLILPKRWLVCPFCYCRLMLALSS